MDALEARKKNCTKNAHIQRRTYANVFLSDRTIFIVNLFNRITLWLPTLFWTLNTFCVHRIVLYANVCTCDFTLFFPSTWFTCVIRSVRIYFYFIIAFERHNRNIKFNSKWVQSINFILNAFKMQNCGHASLILYLSHCTREVGR